MHFMPDHEGLNPEAHWSSALTTYTQLDMAIGQDGFHGTFAHVKMLQLSISCNQPIYIRGTSDTYDNAHDFKRNCVAILHGDCKTSWIPESIVTDQVPKFTSKFWKELHRLMGMKLLMSTSFHPQMDGVMERVNCSISQVLWALVRNNQKDWAELCPMVEFALNSSMSMSMGCVPFELNYGYILQLGQHLHTNMTFVGVKQFIQQALWNVMTAHDAIIASCMMQMHHANCHQQAGKVYSPGNRVYLSTKNLAVPKGRAKKLLPKFIGPYKVIECIQLPQQ